MKRKLQILINSLNKANPIAGWMFCFLAVFLLQTQVSLGQGLDSDGDAVVNTVDLDDDNDGILDKDECNAEWMTWKVVDPTPGGMGTAGDAKNYRNIKWRDRRC